MFLRRRRRALRLVTHVGLVALVATMACARMPASPHTPQPAATSAAVPSPPTSTNASASTSAAPVASASVVASADPEDTPIPVIAKIVVGGPPPCGSKELAHYRMTSSKGAPLVLVSDSDPPDRQQETGSRDAPNDPWSVFEKVDLDGHDPIDLVFKASHPAVHAFVGVRGAFVGCGDDVFVAVIPVDFGGDITVEKPAKAGKWAVLKEAFYPLTTESDGSQREWRFDKHTYVAGASEPLK